MKSSAELRQEFLEFFRTRGHEVVGREVERRALAG